MTWTKADETWTKLAARLVNDTRALRGVGENIQFKIIVLFATAILLCSIEQQCI
jgi:hypothetical protein